MWGLRVKDVRLRVKDLGFSVKDMIIYQNRGTPI